MLTEHVPHWVRLFGVIFGFNMFVHGLIFKEMWAAGSRNRGHGIYPRRLQEEKTKSIGWFLMSTSSLSSDCLCKVLKNTYGITVDIRWSMLRLTRTETFANTPPKAQMVWCADDCEIKYKRILDDIYNAGKDYPLAIRMRFMPMVRDGSQKFSPETRAF